MNCWHCDRPAHGACALCGRGICKEHAKTTPNFVAVYRAKPRKGREKDPGPLRVLAVEEALWCGVCKPREEPLEMPELDA